jgi:outer membrane protein OmpA-like peptidoglycan-associated protein
MKKYISSITSYSAIAGFALLLSSCASMYVKSGKQAYNDLRYQDAIWNLEKGLAKKDNADGRRMLAESYMMVNNYQKANEQYALTGTYTDNSDKDRLMTGQAKMAVGQYSEAQAIFEGILSRDPNNALAKSLLTSCKKMSEMKRDSLYFQVEPVNITSINPIYSAVPYNGGLIVSSPAAKGDKDPYTNNAFTDLYFTKSDNGTWGALEPLSDINSKYHDAVACISPNGQTMVFTRSFTLNSGALGSSKDNDSNTQLYTSKKNPDGTWSKPELVPFCTPQFMFAHPSYSADGQTLYFASNMTGSFGKMDLWESSFTDGSWGIPRNLGGDVNSAGNELFPATKENKLYYSSDGQNTLGGLDILFSEKVNNAWGIPKHLTYPINTSNDDFSLVWNADGTSGYFTSDRTGSDRIYSFNELNPVISYEGLVTGKDSMLPLGGARVTIQNLTDGTEKVVFTDGNGKFATELEPGKEYKIKTEVDGHFTTTEEVSTKGVTKDKNIKQVFELPELYVAGNKGSGTEGGNGTGNGKDVKDPAGKDTSPKDRKGVYDVPSIHWDYNKWDIREDAYPYLDNLVKLFRNNQNLKFEIRSHCDCRGSFEYNDDLSAKRAKAVVDYLITKGVPRSIMMSKGFGERELLNECTDGVFCPEEKHEENRRTEFIVTEKK